MRCNNWQLHEENSLFFYKNYKSAWVQVIRVEMSSTDVMSQNLPSLCILLTVSVKKLYLYTLLHNKKVWLWSVAVDGCTLYRNLEDLSI